MWFTLCFSTYRWQYFGSEEGLVRLYPGREWDTNFVGFYNDYDPRVRPWYIAATSGPKDVVIILDCRYSTAREQLSNGNILECFGIFWNIMEYSKILQDILEYSKSLWFHFILEYSKIFQNVTKYSTKYVASTQCYYLNNSTIQNFLQHSSLKNN